MIYPTSNQILCESSKDVFKIILMRNFINAHNKLRTMPKDVQNKLMAQESTSFSKAKIIVGDDQNNEKWKINGSCGLGGLNGEDVKFACCCII